MRNLSFAIVTVLSVLSIFVLASTASSYDGPVGVTFRAPFIGKAAGTEAIVLEGISVREEVRIDDAWSLKIDGKGRAFPSGFIGTIADSEITFGLHNQGRREVTTSILIPFDASDTEGTGFTKPVSIKVSLDGRPMEIFKGPEFSQGMMKVRSFRIPVKIVAGSTVMVQVKAAHRLAVNPAWDLFVCTDTYVRFPRYRNLAANGCGLEFEFDIADEKLKEAPLKFRWKMASQEGPVTEQKHETIRFKGEAIEWVSVSK